MTVGMLIKKQTQSLTVAGIFQCPKAVAYISDLEEQIGNLSQIGLAL